MSHTIQNLKYFKGGLFMSLPISFSLPTGVSEIVLAKAIEIFMGKNKLKVIPVTWYRNEHFFMMKVQIWYDRAPGVINEILLENQSTPNIIYPVNKMVYESIASDGRLWEMNLGNIQSFFDEYIYYFNDLISISPESPACISLIFRMNKDDNLDDYRIIIKSDKKIESFKIIDFLSEVPNTLEYASQRGIDIEECKKSNDFLYNY